MNNGENPFSEPNQNPMADIEKAVLEMQPEVIEKPELAEIIPQLRDSLPSIATNLIHAHQDMAEPTNVEFADNPDDYLQHAPKWHQYGVVTHSREFARAMKDTIPQYLEDWGLERQADTVLSAEIDGVQKRELLQVASLLHDVGKFTGRKTEKDPETGEVAHHFENHEAHSGSIVRNELNSSLTELGLTNSQIEYIARCTELHFELGKVRRASKGSPTGYSMAFVDTPEFTAAAQEIIDKNPDFGLEIGLQFIADSLSKSEVQSSGTTDEEIENERPALAAEIAEKGLNPNIINQAMQMPVNFKVARRYLTQWAETQAE